MTCPLFCELFIALIAKEFFSAFCFLVLLKKLFVVFLFNLFLNAVSIFRYFLWHLSRSRLLNSCSSLLVITMGNFFLRVVSGILPAVFFLRSVHTFFCFLKSNWSGDFGHAETGNGAKKRVVLRSEFVSLCF